MPAVITPTRIKLQNILFATDFSPSAQSALPYALTLGRSYEARMYSVNVIPHLPFVEGVEPDYEQIRQSATQRMTNWAQSGFSRDVRHKEMIEEGEIPDVLSRLVQEYDIDLIVIGTGGRRRFEKLLLGSVAEEVFRSAACPVLTVGPHAGPWKDGCLRHIVYATDFGSESMHALPYAIAFAEANRAFLTMLHVAAEPGVVLPEPEPGSLPVLDPKEEIASTQKQLRGLIPEANSLWHQPEFLVQFGEAAEAIVKAAQGADMIVLGVKRPTPLTKHLGAGVAYKVACEAPCPVLSVSARYHN